MPSSTPTVVPSDALTAMNCNHRTSIDECGVSLCRVDATLGLLASLGDDYAAVEIKVFVGVDSVVVHSAGIDVAAVDIEVACRVDGIVVAVALHGAGLDVYLALALDGLGAVAGAFQPYLCLSAVKGDVAVGLDAFRRDAALGVLLPLAGGDDAHGTVVDDDLVVAVDALAAGAGGLDVQFAAVDGD